METRSWASGALASFASFGAHALDKVPTLPLDAAVGTKDLPR